MLTTLYTTEEDPALCSIIWGTNFSVTPVQSENDSNAITSASTSHNAVGGINEGGGGGGVGGGGGNGGVIGEGGGYRSEVNAAIAAGAVAVIGDNLRDDLYISNEVSVIAEMY